MNDSTALDLEADNAPPWIEVMVCKTDTGRGWLPISARLLYDGDCGSGTNEDTAYDRVRARRALELLEPLGIRQLVLVPFDRQLAALSPEAFVERVLVQQLGHAVGGERGLTGEALVEHHAQRVHVRACVHVGSGQLGLFRNAYWGHPAYKLPAEVNLLSRAPRLGET